MSEFDDMVEYYSKGKVMAIASRPSLGKTTSSIYLALNLKQADDSRVLYFSLKMSKEKLMERISRFSGPRKNDERRIIIDDTYPQTGRSIVERAKAYSVDNNISMIILDYYQLLSDMETSTVAELKRLAIETSSLVVILSQVSKKADERVNKRPVIQDVRMPKNSIEDLDAILFIAPDGDRAICDFVTKESYKDCSSIYEGSFCKHKLQE